MAITDNNFFYPVEWLGQESIEIARSAARWADSELIEKRLTLSENFDHQMHCLKILAKDIGLHGLILPEEIGGSGLEPSQAASTLVRVYEEVGRADPCIGFLSAINMALAVFVMENKDATEELKKEMASYLVGPGAVDLVSYVPPGLGDNEKRRGILMGREAQAELVKHDQSWSLEGEKARPMNSGYDARMYAVFSSASDGFFLAFVPSTTQGITRGDIIKTTGLLASRNTDIDFAHVTIPQTHVVPIDEVGYMEVSIWMDLLLAAIAIGSAIDVFRLVRDWADNRIIKGKGLLKENPMDAAVLAQVAMDIVNSRPKVHNLARAVTRPESFGIQDTRGLFILAESIFLDTMDRCLHSINRAMEMMGSAGYSKEWNVEKHWRDLKTMQVYMGGRTPMEMDAARYFYGSIEV